MRVQPDASHLNLLAVCCQGQRHRSWTEPDAFSRRRFQLSTRGAHNNSFVTAPGGESFIKSPPRYSRHGGVTNTALGCQSVRFLARGSIPPPRVIDCQGSSIDVARGLDHTESVEPDRLARNIGGPGMLRDPPRSLTLLRPTPRWRASLSRPPHTSHLRPCTYGCTHTRARGGSTRKEYSPHSAARGVRTHHSTPSQNLVAS